MLPLRAKQTRDQQPNRRRAERSRLQAEGVTGGRGGGGGGGGKKRKKVLWMTHPLRLPLRYDASTVGYLQQAQTAVLPSNMIISRARPQPL